jgi:hypothetical protein
MGPPEPAQRPMEQMGMELFDPEGVLCGTAMERPVTPRPVLMRVIRVERGTAFFRWMMRP